MHVARTPAWRTSIGHTQHNTSGHVIPDYTHHVSDNTTRVPVGANNSTTPPQICSSHTHTHTHWKRSCRCFHVISSTECYQPSQGWFCLLFLSSASGELKTCSHISDMWELAAHNRELVCVKMLSIHILISVGRLMGIWTERQCALPTPPTPTTTPTRPASLEDNVTQQWQRPFTVRACTDAWKAHKPSSSSPFIFLWYVFTITNKHSGWISQLAAAQMASHGTSRLPSLLRTEARCDAATFCVLFTCVEEQTSQAEKQNCPPEAQTAVSPAGMKGIWYNRRLHQSFHSCASHTDSPQLNVVQEAKRPRSNVPRFHCSTTSPSHESWLASKPTRDTETKWVNKCKSYEVQSDFFFQPKTPQKPDHLSGAGLVNLFKCGFLRLLDVG